MDDRIDRLEEKVNNIREEMAANREIVNTIHRDMGRLTQAIDTLSKTLITVDTTVSNKLAFGRGFIAAISVLAGSIGALVSWFLTGKVQ